MGLTLFGGCTSDEGLYLPNGSLCLSIGKVSSETETRATPAELGKPVSSQFQLKIQRNDSEQVAYEGNFTDEPLEVRIGTYDITATYGEDVIIGKDAPYYIGTATAVVEKDAQKNVSIPCKVGNALVSVKFGRDQEEKERFSRFYSDYGLLVQVENYSMSISEDETASSIYFPAGSTPTLSFYGKLRDDNDRPVSMPLIHESIPTTFQAADHVILTLTLPNPESALGVNIGKVELETVTLDETIPLSWLPVSAIIPSHQYNEEGMLVGTNLTFSNNYPGMEWKAVVTNAAGEVVRTTSGTGALFSEYKTSSDWPYLPSGKYKATYYLVTEEGDSKTSSREFIIGSPQLTAQLSGYTSYDKYLEGDLEAANATDGLTVYEPKVLVNISSGLVNNPRYNYLLTYTFNGSTQTSTGNAVNVPQQQLAASTVPYVLYAHIAFAGDEARFNKSFQITGLPLKAQPPTEAAGWKATTDYVTFSDSYVRLGKSDWLWGGENSHMEYTNVAIPRGTKVLVDYNIVIHPASMGTTFTCQLGSNEVINHTHDGGAGNSNDYPFEGTNTFTMSSDATSIQCNNEYGAGQTRTDVYKINMTYSK